MAMPAGPAPVVSEIGVPGALVAVPMGVTVLLPLLTTYAVWALGPEAASAAGALAATATMTRPRTLIVIATVRVRRPRAAAMVRRRGGLTSLAMFMVVDVFA